MVPALPKNAKIEWQVWAHRGNSRFQCKLRMVLFTNLKEIRGLNCNHIFSDEETGQRIDKRHKAFLRRRVNYENNVSAVVCYLTKGEAF